jgi:hypothetical protein
VCTGVAAPLSKNQRDKFFKQAAACVAAFLARGVHFRDLFAAESRRDDDGSCVDYVHPSAEALPFCTATARAAQFLPARRATGDDNGVTEWLIERQAAIRCSIRHAAYYCGTCRGATVVRCLAGCDGGDGGDSTAISCMQVVNRVCATVDEVETGVAAGKGALHFACDASRHDKAVALAGQLQIVFHVVWRDDRVDAAVHSTDSGDVDVVRWLDDNVAGLRLRRGDEADEVQLVAKWLCVETQVHAVSARAAVVCSAVVTPTPCARLSAAGAGDRPCQGLRRL